MSGTLMGGVVRDLSTVDEPYESALSRHDRWGHEHVCGDCGWCKQAAPEYPDLTVPQSVAWCTERNEWTDALALAADMCDGRWVPF